MFSLLKPTIFFKWDCLNSGGEWLIKYYNFDDIFNAMMTLFQVATLAGWTEIMYNAMSITGTESDFRLKNKPEICLFFIIFVIVGAFFTLNLFVGIVISTFNREKDKLGKNFLLTDK